MCEDVKPKVSWGLEVEECATSGRKAVPARDWTRRTETTEVSLTHDKSVKPETFQDLRGSDAQGSTDDWDEHGLVKHESRDEAADEDCDEDWTKGADWKQRVSSRRCRIQRHLGWTPNPTSIEKSNMSTDARTSARALGMEALSSSEHRQLTQIPAQLQNQIGLGLRKCQDDDPRRAVGVFFQRYDGHTNKDWSYRHECGAGGTFRATLVTPSFFNKEITGTEKASKKEAERSAAVCFCQDAEAIEAAKHLPLLMDKIRRHVVNSSSKPLKTSFALGFDCAVQAWMPRISQHL